MEISSYAVEIKQLDVSMIPVEIDPTIAEIRTVAIFANLKKLQGEKRLANELFTYGNFLLARLEKLQINDPVKVTDVLLQRFKFLLVQ